MIDPRAVLARARARFASIESPWPLASALALALFAAADTLLGGSGQLDVWFALSLAGLVASIGTLHGIAWQLAQATVGKLPARARPVVWSLAAAAGGLLLASRLGAFGRLHGRYASAALAVIGARLTGALGLALLLSALQPAPDRPRGYLGSLRRSTRVELAALLIAATVLLAVADRILYVRLYPDAHTGMRLAALLLASSALVIVDAELRVPRLSLASLGLVLLLATVPFVVVDAGRLRLLEAFGTRPWCATLLDAARSAVDLDRDGYATWLGGGDCAPFDPRVNPSARELPGNGIDDNCMFGDAERTANITEPIVPAREPSPLDVVLITIDALRADHLGVYDPAYRGPGRPTSPNLDRWARGATVFERAYTSGAWTSIAMASLMHGMYARRLHWTRYYETTHSYVVRKHELSGLRKGDRAERMFPLAFDDPRRPLALRLQQRGMKTAAVVDDGYTEMLKTGTGLERGFDTFADVDRQPIRKRNDEGAIDSALTVLNRLTPGKRFFLWVHLFGPHGPNERHAGVPHFGNTPTDLYDHEIAFADKQLQRLLSVLDARKNPVAVLIAADHGELLYPTMRMHGHTLEEGSIHVPLIAKVPGWRPGRVRASVSLVDVMPTILRLTRTPWLAPLDGIDLAPLANGKSAPQRILLTDTWKFQRETTDDPEEPQLDLVAAHDSDRKLIFDRLRQMWMAYPTAREASGDASTNTIPSDDLQRMISGYLEDTGGSLRVRD